MRSKHLLRIVVLLAMLFSVLGTGTQVQAKENSVNVLNAVIVIRSITYWDATYSGTVNVNRYERWPFEFTEANSFTITATPTSGDLVPLVVLLDVNGNEISSTVGTLNSVQPAGDYSVLIQPQSGGGNYDLAIRRVEEPVEGPSVSVVFNPATVNVDESSVGSINLNNVPAGGYASAEFTCTYDPAFLEVSGIADAGLFGADAVMVVGGPANGSFLVAIAGSNGKKATTSGAALTFSAKALQQGQTSVECVARVSTGDQTLDTIASTPGGLNITVPNGTLAGQVIASKPVTVNVYNADNSLAGSVAANPDGTFTLSLPSGTYTAIASAEGFLDAQGTPAITSGNTTTLSTVSLLAGDIDNNDVIDQFDALTIGMSYNASSPTAADLNNDGIINVLDLELLAANYNQSGSLAWP
ncbi:MAG: carboxypeptidase regulatory-like domain-containing protein [Anaerolineales bacterium]|nr:carboxypeptidase regulatory-like domain-containing protein [Anaerolineales bacterium]